ncbi:NADPH:quinone oxidoreductase family protein [Sediminibacillus albus]|uniref:Putative quinone oxidoreductase, YhdH/YhfP family n=1 Tax=Sediminibacillus albus TaxID=407036 RepID=A0A1G8ZWT6_9BACI|nr:acryloyl-CoA reductase [Sediminibacillus albus]SDK19523.1 putative quinone oxidoreductase, YhdH/YhfP family [Sediminibacillus albus]
MNEHFRAYKVNQTDEGFFAGLDTLQKEDLPNAEVLIKVHYSSVNFKDGIANTADNKIVESYPMVPGIDLSGEVVESTDSRFKEGDQVIATSYQIGTGHYGGYSEYARIPADWIVPLPDGLTLQEAMILGTAGFTAALSIQQLEASGLHPGKGKVLVTGATGGVGSTAIAMLAKRGYHVVASTGKESSHGFLQKIGANEIVSREAVFDGKIRPLDKQEWAGAVDPVGGKQLASLLTKLEYGGAAAVSGLTGGTDVPTAVFPFISRGIQLLGVDSVNCPMETRKKVWQRLADDLKPEGLAEHIQKEITLNDLPESLNMILEGRAQGRMVVNLLK